ncbi:potassium channel subfamily K member 13 [Thalassophryne amazonica]|uniref:potassium channel subfamily K member 13 n=1 Tax=Thalassophryne amazonica TaxID=390379 RepID=UPI001470A9B6|nr:potassium channel subfamily K member 13 [Thalassophryne amazonica]
MKDCCWVVLPSRETARFFLLFFLIALYMLAGAAMFSCLERPAELQAHQLWQRRLMDFTRKHNIKHEDLKYLLCHYEKARTAGIRAEGSRALWDIPGAFYFVGTVVSTIGFGVTAPSTTAGKVLLVFYGLLGCSTAILFFNLFLERVITFLSLLIVWCHRRKVHASSGHESSAREDGRNKERKPSVFQVTLILFCAVMVVTCSSAALYSAMEDWSYFESMYFCFVAFSTVGFGDLVSGQKQHHEHTRAYQMANCLLMLLGVCCSYSLFNAISVIVKQGLNWILGMLDWMFRSICTHRPRFRPLFTQCLADVESLVCHREDDVLHRQQAQAVTSLGHNALWHACVPSTMVKCLCDEAQVKTVSNKNIEESFQNNTSGL